MNSLFTIHSTGYNLASLTFLISFLVVFTTFIVIGHKRKYPLLPWIVALSTIYLFATIGGKLISYNLDDWSYIFKNFKFPATSNKRLYGYLIGAIAGYFIAKSTLKFNFKILDIVAFTWPIRLMITRIGCLLGGCCYGIPTDSIFGIRYAKNFPAFSQQVHQHLIASGDTYTLNIHPTQLYDMLICLSLIFVLLFIKKKQVFKHSHNLFLFSVIYYSAFRFFEEFIRADGNAFHGLKIIQWSLLAAIVILSLLVIFYEKKVLVKNIETPSEIKNRQSFILAFITIALIVMGNSWFTVLELIILKSVIVLLIIGITFQIIHLANRNVQVRISTLTFLAAMVFMSQKAEIDSTFVPSNYFSISAGGLKGMEEGICDGPYPYNAVGIDLAYNLKKSNYDNVTIGANIYKMNYDGVTNIGMNPYFNVDRKKFGIGIGLNMSNYVSEYRGTTSFPSMNLRIGVPNRFFVDGKYSSHFPSGLPAMQLGVGFGLKKWDNSVTNQHIRIGLCETGVYVNPHLALNKNLIIDPFVAYGGVESYTFGLSLQYNLDNK